VAPGGQRTVLTVNADGYLASVTDPAGGAVALTYGSGGLLSTLTDARGGGHRFTYDAQGRLTRDQDPAGAKMLGRTEQGDGYTVALTDPLNRTTTYQVAHLPMGVEEDVQTDPSGLRTVRTMGMDGSDRTTAPDGTETSTLETPDPRFGMQAPVFAVQEVATPGRLINQVLETRLATLSDPGNPLSLTRLTDAFKVNGETYTITFDAAARQFTLKSPEGRTQTTLLDAKGHVVQTQVPGEDAVQLSYDAHGNLRTVTQGTRTETLAYDARMNLRSATDPLNQTVTFAHDPDGRLIQVTLADGSQVGFGYDANGNLTSVTPPGRPAHTFDYTPTDLTQDYVPPDVGAGANRTQYAYDVGKQLTLVTLPDGATLTPGYDPAGRLSTLTLPQGTMTFTYNPTAGNLKTLTAPGGEAMTYGYDGSLPTDAAWSGPVSGSVDDTLDPNFRLMSETVNGADPVPFGYDGDGLLTRAGDLTLGRDPDNGRLTGSTLGTVSDTLTYDNFGEVTGYQATAGGANLLSFQDTPDALGRVSQRTETVGGVSHAYAYSYDPAGRLTKVTQDGTVTAQYTYDANGNRLSFTGPGGSVTGTYDNQDRLLTYGTLTYTYKADGSLASKTDTATNRTTTYTYDALGNLLAVTLPDGTRLDYVVDGQGRRVGKKVNGTLAQGFLYEGGRVVAELDGSGNVVSRFVYAGGSNVPAYLVKGGVEYRLLTDQVGSVRLVVNAATGAVVQRLDYDAFGNVTQDTNPGFQPFGFAGGVYDRDTGLVRFGARDYDAATGRWTAKDPLRFAGGDPNLYAYVSNDPVNARDPAGLQLGGAAVMLGYGLRSGPQGGGVYGGYGRGPIPGFPISDLAGPISPVTGFGGQGFGSGGAFGAFGGSPFGLGGQPFGPGLAFGVPDFRQGGGFQVGVPGGVVFGSSAFGWGVSEKSQLISLIRQVAGIPPDSAVPYDPCPLPPLGPLTGPADIRLGPLTGLSDTSTGSIIGF
jgi:RHS repeat-associated protein